MSNLNAFRKQGMQHRVVGQNIGERAAIKKQKAQQINNIPPSQQQQVDAFSNKNVNAAEPFRSKGDRFLGKVARYVRRETTDHAAYRHEKVQRTFHEGHIEPSNITDEQRLAYLETIISTPTQQTAGNKRFAADAKKTRRPYNTGRPVDPSTTT